MNLITCINMQYDKMSKGQKRIAEYIMLHYDKAVFMTAARIGTAVSVSESTVVRFANLLGYKGYPEFQQALEDLVQEKLTAVKKIDISNSANTKLNIPKEVMESDINKLKETQNLISEDAFKMATSIIDSSKKIYICGLRSCKPIADFLAFYLGILYENVIVLGTNSSSELLEQMYHISEKDCIIGISFPRYSMRTLKAMEFANNRNAKVICITDDINSPMTLYSSCNLYAKSELSSVVDSLAAPMSVVNVIITMLYIKHQKKVLSNMEELETIWEDYQVNGKDDINMVEDNMYL